MKINLLQLTPSLFKFFLTSRLHYMYLYIPRPIPMSALKFVDRILFIRITLK